MAPWMAQVGLRMRQALGQEELLEPEQQAQAQVDLPAVSLVSLLRLPRAPHRCNRADRHGASQSSTRGASAPSP